MILATADTDGAQAFTGFVFLAIFVLLLLGCIVQAVQLRRARRALRAVAGQVQAQAAELAAERARVTELRREASGLRGDPWRDARG